MGTNRKPIEGSQIPELLTLFQKVKQGKKPKDTPCSFCISRNQIETLDQKIKEQIVTETREKAAERNILKREKKIVELDKKLAGKKINKTVYKKELSLFDANFEAYTENEITKAVEKAHTYHFNLQNYRASDDKQTEFPLVKLKNLITINNNRIKPVSFSETEFTILGVSKQIGVFVNEKTKGKDIKQSYFRVEKNEFCYNPYRINVGSIGLCELEIENQIISGAYNIFSCDENKINPKFLDALFKTSKFLDYVNENATGGVRMDFKIEFMQRWKIPLPPLEIQNEIVEKIEKQKQIIEGSDIINKNYELEINNEEGELVILGDVCEFEYGKALKETDRIIGDYPVFGSSGIVGYHNQFIVKAPFIIVGRKGSAGKVNYSDKDGFPIDTTFFIKNTEKINLKYLYYILNTLDLSSINTQAAVPGLNRKDAYKVKILVPSLEVQCQIVEKLDRQMAALESICFLKDEAEKRIEEILAGMWKEKPVGEVIEFTQDAVVQKESDVEEKAFLKRKVLATYIINQSLNDPHFGDVKFEKLFYLSECFILKRNFGQKYYVQAAGPYDNIFTRVYFKQIEQSKWFIRRRNGNQYTFSKGENHDKSLNIYSLFSDNELERINMLISYFKKWTYELPEIIATLYAVWNNRIIKQELVTDDLLKKDFLNWDEQKIKFKDRLDNALNWMQEKRIVPDGWGKVIEKANKRVQKARK
jgi:restriction endonuclease S subunit